jgi:peptidylprolyl isomerase
MRWAYTIFAIVIGVLVAGAGLFAVLGDSAADPTVSDPTTTATSAAASTAPAAATPRQGGAPPMTIDPQKSYVAVLKTDKGDIRIRLRPDLAPKHVNSFVTLAKQGFYNGVTFHRVLPGFVAQTGDPTGTGTGGPGYTVEAEFTNTPFVRGVIGAARSSDPNSAGSQFFITFERAANLDNQYTVFGEVTEGMDAALALTPRDPQRNPNAPPGDKLQSVEIIES